MVGELSDTDFKLFSMFIYDQCGIKLPMIKKTMLSVRLAKRLRLLKMISFRKYYEYVKSGEGMKKELIHMIDVVTTNKTNFFREAKHFEVLTEKVIPALVHSRPDIRYKQLFIWSAGCSTGEEPYTIAMVMEEFINHHTRLNYSILCTDISTHVLHKASNGIYEDSQLEGIPMQYIKKYTMRGKGRNQGKSRIIPELQDRLTFCRVNLNEGPDFGIKTQMDIIFCRNVIIYFDRETQKKLFEKYYHQLYPGGYLFIGHSETLHGINDQFIPVDVSVYRKPLR
ncbi:MAG: chemotaxis protein CheR [Candidatus Magnetomorum sp.]|nr:chemotaxis protein CheR [Candidatus Magnetomorum sp.]